MPIRYRTQGGRNLWVKRHGITETIGVDFHQVLDELHVHAVRVTAMPARLLGSTNQSILRTVGFSKQRHSPQHAPASWRCSPRHDGGHASCPRHPPYLSLDFSERCQAPGLHAQRDQAVAIARAELQVWVSVELCDDLGRRQWRRSFSTQNGLGRLLLSNRCDAESLQLASQIHVVHNQAVLHLQHVVDDSADSSHRTVDWRRGWRSWRLWWRPRGCPGRTQTATHAAAAAPVRCGRASEGQGATRQFRWRPMAWPVGILRAGPRRKDLRPQLRVRTTRRFRVQTVHRSRAFLLLETAGLQKRRCC